MVDLSACIRASGVILLTALPEPIYLALLMHDPAAVVYLLSLILLSLWIVFIVYVALHGRVRWAVQAPWRTRRLPSSVSSLQATSTVAV